MKAIKLITGQNKSIHVTSIKEASKAILNITDKIGSNKFYSLAENIGEIFNEATGKKIGYVSYNGKVWDNNNTVLFNPYL